MFFLMVQVLTWSSAVPANVTIGQTVLLVQEEIYCIKKQRLPGHTIGLELGLAAQMATMFTVIT